MTDLGNPIGMLTVHHGPNGITLTGTGGVQITAGTVPGALRALASALDGKPLNPTVIGVALVDLPPGAIALSAAMSIKALSPEGIPAYYERISGDLTLVEALGMVSTFRDTITAHLVPPR
jgi:hypothetical protein